MNPTSIPHELTLLSHRRRNLLTGDWVLVSPQRTQRPWLGAVDAPARANSATHDPGCYLCPGNTRANGSRNPSYTHTFVFDNDFPALNSSATGAETASALLVAAPVSGSCRVICYSPRHDLSLGDLGQDDAEHVVATWVSEWRALHHRADLAYTLIFENRGEMMGASNPHPHGQLWASSVIPDIVAREQREQKDYAEQHGRPLLTDYLRIELEADRRIVLRNDDWVALVPFWAEWPFELLLLPVQPVSAFDRLTIAQTMALAEIVPRLVRVYDRVFDTAFPYSMGWHGRPNDAAPHEEWVLHAHFLPPLLRSASVRKFRVGFELLGMPQRDLTPEAAAERLRAIANTESRA